MKTCTPSFDTNACPAGQDCTYVLQTTTKTLTFLCKPIGTGTQGTTCVLDEDREAKSICSPLHTCATVCNAAHPCGGDAGDAGGLHCSDFGTADYGYCE